jgi:hypothetical protein
MKKQQILTKFLLTIIVVSTFVMMNANVSASTLQSDYLVEPNQNVWEKYKFTETDFTSTITAQSNHIETRQGTPNFVKFTQDINKWVGDDTIVYQSHVIFDIPLNVFTSNSIENTLQITDSTLDLTYVKLALATDFRRVNLDSPYKIYSFGNTDHSRIVEFQTGSVSLTDRQITLKPQYATMQPQSFVDFDFQLAPKSIDFEALGIKITSSNIQTNLDYTRVSTASKSDLGTYNNVLNSALPNVQFTANAGDYKGTLSDMTDRSLGIRASAIQPEAPTLKQGTNAHASVGEALYQNKKLQFEMQPNIVVNKQSIDCKYEELVIDTNDGFNNPSGLLYTKDGRTTTHQRTLGAYIQNKQQQYVIQVGFTIIATCVIEKQDILLDNDLDAYIRTLDDYVWDNYMEGDTEITAPKDSQTDFERNKDAILDSITTFFEENGWWILIALFALIAIVAFVLYQKAQQQRMIMLALSKV